MTQSGIVFCVIATLTAILLVALSAICTNNSHHATYEEADEGCEDSEFIQ